VSNDRKPICSDCWFFVFTPISERIHQTTTQGVKRHEHSARKAMAKIEDVEREQSGTGSATCRKVGPDFSVSV
jgi:hypothetical protein